jgi:hypothetical protein
MITVNMTKARDVHRSLIRIARAPLLSDLDVEYQRAIESSADTSAIVAKKQALRDAPTDPEIDLCQTTEELRAQWDTALLGPSLYDNVPTR